MFCITTPILNLFFGEMMIFLFHFGVDLVEVIVQILKDHVELLGDQKNLLEFDNVWMIKFS